MSREELRRLEAGQTVINESKHKGCFTQSKGFCFTEDDPEVAIRYLSGNVDTDVCVTFDVSDGMMTKTEAIYRDVEKDNGVTMPMRRSDIPTIKKTEYCCTRYSLKQVKILTVTTAFSSVPGIKETKELLKLFGYKKI